MDALSSIDDILDFVFIKADTKYKYLSGNLYCIQFDAVVSDLPDVCRF
nr:MAG TPA: hypothetical protein [Bacteriophage sp.]